MNLKTEDGRQVYIGWNKELCVLDGERTFKKVDRAMTCDGESPFFTDEQIDKFLEPSLSKYNLVERVWRHSKEKWKEIEFVLRVDKNMFSGGTVYTLGGVKISWEDYLDVISILDELNSFNRKSQSIYLENSKVPLNGVLDMIGVGNFVTRSSLLLGCKEGDSKQRFAVGNRVEYEIGGNTYSGVITRLSNKARIARMDGVVNTKSYDSIRLTEKEIFNELALSKLHPSIEDNFRMAFEENKSRIYRAEVMSERFVFPLFPSKGSNSMAKENALTCPCPICGYRMGGIGGGKFICNFCKEEGQVIDSTEETVTLLLRALPSKNKVAMSESRCCMNCINSPFSVTRISSALYGFCETAQKGVELCNVCKFWFPRNSHDYLIGLRAKVRQMKSCIGKEYSRGLESFVYTEEEYDALMKECKELGVFYENAHQKLNADLRMEGKEGLYSNGQHDKDEFINWKEILSEEVLENKENVSEVHIERDNP